jgi:predicted MFS family arabinose efflux permease
MLFFIAFSEQLPTLALISLGASETLIGVQSGLRLGLLALQLPALRLISWFSKKQILFAGQLVAQLASLPLVAFSLLAGLEPSKAQWLVFAALAVTAAGIDLADLVWYPLLRAYVEPDRIGRLFGVIRSSWHAALIVFFIAAQAWLSRHDGGFGLLFGVAWLAGAVRMGMFLRLPERSERSAERIRAREAFALVRSHPALRSYLLGVGWGYAARLAAIPFVLVMLRRGLGLSNANVVATTIAQYAGGLVSLYLWGMLVDRLGPYVVIRFTALSLAALFLGLAWLEPGPGLERLAVAFFFVYALLAAGYGVADTQLVFGLAPAEAPARTFALVSVVVGVTSGVAPALAGAVLDPLLARAEAPLPVYHGFFAAAAALHALSFLPLRHFRRK